MSPSLASRHSWFEATARKRIAGLLDPGSFVEILPPAESSPSPHLAKLDLPGAFDDGIVIGCGQLGKKPIFVATHELTFRFTLSDSVQAGSHAWPMRISAVPI